jgi:MoxR-like ATPase
MMKVIVGYPTETEEFVIVQRQIGRAIELTSMASTDELAQLQQTCKTGYVDPALIQYAVKIVAATRHPEHYALTELSPLISFGASPRGTISLIEGARALAFLRGRSYVLPQDIQDLVLDVLRHRVVLSYEAIAQGKTTDDLLRQILKTIPVPSQALPLDA